MKKLTHRVTESWNPKKMIIEFTDEKFIPNAGNEAVLWNFNESPLSKRLLECLPERESNASCGSKTYAYMFLLGFLNEFDTIDDLEKLKEDYWALEFFDGKIPTPKACGNFLRDFDEEHLKKLNKFLRHQARAYRASLSKVHGWERELIIDLDSSAPRMKFLKHEAKGFSMLS